MRTSLRSTPWCVLCDSAVVGGTESRKGRRDDPLQPTQSGPNHLERRSTSARLSTWTTAPSPCSSGDDRSGALSPRAESSPRTNARSSPPCPRACDSAVSSASGTTVSHVRRDAITIGEQDARPISRATRTAAAQPASTTFSVTFASLGGIGRRSPAWLPSRSRRAPGRCPRHSSARSPAAGECDRANEPVGNAVLAETRSRGTVCGSGVTPMRARAFPALSAGRSVLVEAIASSVGPPFTAEPGRASGRREDSPSFRLPRWRCRRPEHVTQVCKPPWRGWVSGRSARACSSGWQAFGASG